MPRGSQQQKPINFKDLPCPHRGCIETFRSKAGRTNHVRTMHPRPTSQPDEPTRLSPHLQDPSPPMSPGPAEPEASYSPPGSPPPGPERHPRQSRTYHPFLSSMFVFIVSIDLCFISLHRTGKPCDENGQYLPKGSPPPPRPAQAADDWTPFSDSIQFKLADFLYRQEEMSQGNINHLLELWALSLMRHGSLGPFDSYKHIYDTIDAIEEGNYFNFLCLMSHSCETVGDAPWKCFKTSFDEPIEENAPNWKKQEYNVWYRDPEVVAHNMLANSDFAKEFDPAPYVELDANGGRRRSDFMSGNFAWRQSVSRLHLL